MIDASDAEIDFFLAAGPGVVELETLEVSHPSWSKVYRVVRNNSAGMTARLETGEQVFFSYYPLQISGSQLTSDLNYQLKVSIGDLGEEIPKEIDRVDADDSWDIYPVVKYRTFRSDDLENVMMGPIVLDLSAWTFNQDGFGFTAEPPDIKTNGTGMLYRPDVFLALRGFLYN